MSFLLVKAMPSNYFDSGGFLSGVISLILLLNLKSANPFFLGQKKIFSTFQKVPCYFAALPANLSSEVALNSTSYLVAVLHSPYMHS